MATTTKTAISLPNDLFAFVENEAKTSKRTRSAVIAEAVARAREARRRGDMRASYDRVYADPELRRQDAAFARAASHGVGRIMKEQDGGW